MGAWVWDDGVDATVGTTRETGGAKAIQNVMLTLQLKSTRNWKIENDAIKYPLSAKNYRKLIGKSTCSQFLVLYTLPKDRADWIRTEDDCTRFRHLAYYLSLEGAPSIPEKQKKRTVTVPICNVFDARSLIGLFESEVKKW